MGHFSVLNDEKSNTMKKSDMGIDNWPTGTSHFLLPTCCTHGFVDAPIAQHGLKWKEKEKAVGMHK